MKANNCRCCGRKAKVTRLEDIVFVECLSRRNECKKKTIIAAFGSNLAIKTWNKLQRESEVKHD